MELNYYSYIQSNQTFYYKPYIPVHPMNTVSTPTRVHARSRSIKEFGVNTLGVTPIPSATMQRELSYRSTPSTTYLHNNLTAAP
jgi:hypothetical protein